MTQLLDMPLNRKDRVVWARDGNGFARIRQDVHFDATLIQIRCELH
jgi:hypothetical protein